VTEVPEPVRDLDWDPRLAREFGERALDIWTEMLARLDDDLPVSRQQTAAEVREAVAIEVPAEPMPVDSLVAYLRDMALERSIYPGHPGFLAYVSGAGTVPGAAADLIAAGLNQNLGGWRVSPAGTEIEQQLIRWFVGRFGLPEHANGFITSGGAMANMIGLTVARTVKAGFDARKEGLRGRPQLTVYCSAEVHDTVDRAVQMLGIGDAGLRKIAVDDGLRMNVPALRAAIEHDLEESSRPLAVVASAGTVGTGAIDPLNEIADICDEFDLWLHIDGAYGGSAALVSSLRPLFSGIERADSIGFDPHKWLYTPIAGAAILVRDRQHLADTFSVDAAYTWTDTDATGWGIDLYALSPHFTRGFAALKIWVSLLAHGWDAYERRIAHDVVLARYLYDQAQAHPELEVFGEPTLSIACFRYVPVDLGDRSDRELYLDQLNERILVDLQLEGPVFPSNAVIDGHFALRACIVNFRTEADTLDALIEASVEHGRRIDAELRSA